MSYPVSLYQTNPEHQLNYLYVSTSDIFGCVIAFYTLFFVIQLVMRDTANFTSRYVSTIHSIILSVLTVGYLLNLFSIGWWHYFQYIPIGYMLFDLSLIYFHPGVTSGTIMMIHHLLFLSFTIFYLPYQPRIVAIGYLSEFTTPFLNMYFYHRYTNHTTANWYAIRGLVIWPIVRIANFSIGIYVLFVIFENYVATIGAIILTTMNTYWYYIMICKIYKN